jgi:hypothetical protein
MMEQVAFQIVFSYEGRSLSDEEDSYEAIEDGLQALMDKVFVDAQLFPDQSRKLINISIQRIPIA